MKRTLLFALILTAAHALGQCTTNSSGGTSCVGPLTVTSPAGSNPTTVVGLTPATATNLCKSISGTYSVCGQSNQITVDFGDGKGFVPLTGPQGPVGATGAVGPQGATGAQGPTGARGETGPTGAQGQTGPAGLNGQTGSQGPAGPVGATGATGLAGSAGPAGPQGNVGPIGVPGAQGAPGNVGPTGPQGPIGLTGAQGPAGAALPFTATCDLISWTKDAAGYHAQLSCH